MSSDLRGATSVLKALLSFERPLPELQEALKEVPVDIPDVVVLTRRDVRGVLQRFIDGELGTQAVEDWANLVEGLDGIGFEAGWVDELSEAIHTLANPYLTSQLNAELIRGLIHEFQKTAWDKVKAEAESVVQARPTQYDSLTLDSLSELLALLAATSRPAPSITPGYWPTSCLTWSVEGTDNLEIEVFPDRYEVYRFFQGKTDIWYEPRGSSEDFSAKFLSELPRPEDA